MTYRYTLETIAAGDLMIAGRLISKVRIPSALSIATPPASVPTYSWP